MTDIAYRLRGVAAYSATDVPTLKEAADTIEALTDRIRALEEALRPFAETCKSGIDDDDVPTLSIWDHPAALSVTIADLRRARDVLKGEG